ncbi:MAG: Gfo/Idh/MocA family protein [Candidatus Binataceae bacterium]
MGRLRGAISGFGEVAAKAHLTGWRTRDGINISVIHDPVSERRHEAIRLIKNVRVYDDLELMLDGEALDFVDIASPPAYHATAARLALKARAHVLVEKPLCLSLAEFDELAGLARTNGRILMCVHNWKYAPAYAMARQLIDDGRVGAVNSLSLDRLRTEPAGTGRAGGAWRSASDSGGGILIDHGWHVFYLMQWLMGDEAPGAISASLSGEAGGTEEVADLRVRFSSGRAAQAHLSWRAAARKTSATISGENGTLEIEGDRAIFTDGAGVTHDLSVQDIVDDSYHSTWFAGMAAAFERAISEGIDSPTARTNLNEARNALSLIVAARESAKSLGAEISIAS